MIVRIIERSRVEAALARFDAWWGGLSQRERVLVGTLAALLAVVVLVYGVVKPLQAARAEARADIRQFETLQARIRAAGTLPSAPVAVAAGSPEAQVSAAATRVGVTATTAAVPGGVRAVAVDAPYDAVVRWIDEVTRTTPMGATAVTMTRAAAPGRVGATVDFTR